jgi:hypothetical protein
MPIVKYQGPQPLPLELDLPIPYLSKAEWCGTVIFNPTAEVDEKTAEFLIAECGNAFVGVEMKPEGVTMGKTVATTLPPSSIPAEIHQPHPWLERALGKVFTGKAGKWNAKAYIAKHHLSGLVEISRVPNGWQIVALSVETDGRNQPIPVMAGGHMEEQDGDRHAADRDDAQG